MMRLLSIFADEYDERMVSYSDFMCLISRPSQNAQGFKIQTKSGNDSIGMIN